MSGPHCRPKPVNRIGSRRRIFGACFHEIAAANHVVLPQEPLFDSYFATVLAFLASGQDRRGNVDGSAR